MFTPYKACLTVTALVTGMSRAAACFQGRMLRDSFVWRIRVTANCEHGGHKITFNLNNRYLGLHHCDAAASREWFPTFRMKVSPSFSRVMWTKVFDLWEGRRYFLSTRRELSPEDRASYPWRCASSVTRLLCTKNSNLIVSIPLCIYKNFIKLCRLYTTNT
jgi:hypothetical protein